MTKTMLATLALVAATGGAGSAAAAGCNGVVNQLVWGCAAWDNNNGPQYPNWKGAPPARAPAPPLASLKPSGSASVAAMAYRPTNSLGGRPVAKVNGVWTYMVAAGGGNFAPAGAVPAGMVAAGGLN